MYVAPLASVLPDLTLPARGDSPFNVSLLQPRFAELWEVGWAQTDDDQIGGLLSDIYATKGSDGGDRGFAEIAEIEQHRPASTVSRRALGWKALLWMRPTPPNFDPASWRSRSVLMSSAGPAVLRPGPNRYVALECGGTGTGHGHPDILHFTLVDREPWFLDFGTGSYVSPTLRWHRSTLSHNAPSLVGVGQRGQRGWCSAFETVGDWAWCQGTAPELFGPEFTATRTILVGPHYVLDVVDIAAPDDAVVDLPLHPLGAIRLPDGLERHEVDRLEVYGGLGHEHGYDAIEGAVELHPPPSSWNASRDDTTLEIRFAHREGERVYLARAQGPPTLDFGDSGLADFLVRRAAGSGRWVQVYSVTPGAIMSVDAVGDHITIQRQSGALDRVERLPDGIIVTPDGEETVTLRGMLPQPPARPSHHQTKIVRLRCALMGEPPRLDEMFWQIPPMAIVPLGALNYRRSELEYPGESAFSARVGLCATGTRLFFAVDVRKPELVLRPEGAADPKLDNEAPDIHADGVQLFVRWDAWAGYLVLPDPHEPRVRARAVGGTGAEVNRVEGEWRRTASGYQMLISCDVGEVILPGQEFLVNVVINQMLPGRERRAGQLALVGGGGWVYLRGDREYPADSAQAEVR
jgi:hypothetical protein